MTWITDISYTWFSFSVTLFLILPIFHPLTDHHLLSTSACQTLRVERHCHVIETCNIIPNIPVGSDHEAEITTVEAHTTCSRDGCSSNLHHIESHAAEERKTPQRTLSLSCMSLLLICHWDLGETLCLSGALTVPGWIGPVMWFMWEPTCVCDLGVPLNLPMCLLILAALTLRRLSVIVTKIPPSLPKRFTQEVRWLSTS